MQIFAIGDLHLSFSDNKPMDIFGDNWKNHYIKIKENWLSKITENDVVLLPGDFSWAIDLQGSLKDFEYLNSLPGKKVMINGNHDYWWTSKKKMEAFLEENNFKNIYFIKNNAIEFENFIIVGTRGWSFTDSENSEKMYSRELIRLENSITYAYENFINKVEDDKINNKENDDINNKNKIIDNVKLNTNSKKIICMMHYPPITKAMYERGEKSEYIELLKKYNVTTCIYGHLHGEAHNEAVEGNIDGVNLKLVSSDYLNFNPYQLTNENTQ